MTVLTAPRLAPGVRLHRTADGDLLRTADGTLHAVHLPPAEADELRRALVADRRPRTPTAAAAYEALGAAGHLRPTTTPTARVHGTGPLADATAAALRRMGAAVEQAAGDRLRIEVTAPRTASVEAWSAEGHVVVAPRAVPLADVVARWRAAGHHRRLDEVAPAAEVAPTVVAASTTPSPRAVELVAHTLASEALDRADGPGENASRDAYLATTIDLRTLAVARRPVLPVPTPPR
ncbi:hypothetical protein QE364_003212 [Nocardioides zeae]|uniref:Uncharacterized protein n=2 Tax=Nocardioides zeae TaxID=1457234 RepID=A0AAJ1X569_9ACTN|nr:hypothetical protein [Nocardioides zeae]MDQ1106357.1 hypothetical protein [Nocardioides zeae]MDR6173956.1 hypothetical protein [Nocardioides zeae]MDR6211488.1 hypothetical protein [Nocardioides zeae]